MTAVTVLAMTAGLIAQTNVHAVADKVDQRYNAMHTSQAEFVETYTGAGMSRICVQPDPTDGR